MAETFRYPVGSTIVDIPIALQMPFRTPAYNLAEAHRMGIRPITFLDIEQFCKSLGFSLKDAVLTDESGTFPELSNNWRIVELGRNSLILQLTEHGCPGLIDIKEFPRIEVDRHETLFTGVIIAYYTRRDNGRRISLQHYHDLGITPGVTLARPEIDLSFSQRYLADENGSLS